MTRRISQQPTLADAIAAAMQDKRLTKVEARAIAEVAKREGVTGQSEAVQQMVDRWGDRFDPGAGTELGGLARHNNVDGIRENFEEAQDHGSVNQEEMENIIADIKEGGTTEAERRELVRMAELNRLTANARGLHDTFRVTPDAGMRNPFNQRLPTGPGQDGNRVINPRTGNTQFAVRQDLLSSTDGVRMLDGEGKDRGRLIPGSVQVNYGQRRTFGGEPYIYAFATRIETPHGERSVSGWIPERALKDPLPSMPSIEAPKPLNGDMSGSFTITGGDPAKYGDLKVAPNIPREERVAAGDYMRRPSGVVNLLYNLPGKGGVSTDTFKTGATFVRSAGVEPVDIQLYKPGSSEEAGTMTFVYGRVGDRYGWIAEDAIQKN